MLYAAIETIETTDSAPVEQEAGSSVVPPDAERLEQVSLGGVGEEGLYFQRCRWCQTTAFRRLLCPVCASTDFARERSCGIGVVRHVMATTQSFGRRCVLATIDMDEGFWVSSKIIGVPPRVRLGVSVCLTQGVESGAQTLLFRLTESPRH
ncbi:Zn-ribbon domain-containing OB-fold protein [Streptomyces sp. NBC_01716]|uniref:Zn-ribbon domain-containing OB-fold protein n=1 Tax=Streptomyces sp. NBC_01716 TaxID=2975917 RepID=UPI002E354DA1|nr:hypothetical protein [Streptomyces sp. NBC_01716]